MLPFYYCIVMSRQTTEGKHIEMVSKQDNAQVLKYARARVWRDTFKCNHEKDVKHIKLEVKMAVI